MVKFVVTIDEKIEDIEVHIHAANYSEEVEKLVESLKTPKMKMIAGYREQEVHMLKIEDIFSIFTEGGKVYVQTELEDYQVKKKLYEFESLLYKEFVRVNKSTLVNLQYIQCIRVGLLGTTNLYLENEVCYPISRKYLRELKDRLGIGGNMV
ncbi:LytTR family DNA-binding domain-containing protein [Kurthia gibsonii]|uniref:LytTR family DNA-binding domain-containing protein n=1 Tax=Kurthia gibsonii TaxID=33946 RepID=UPI003F21F81A